MKLSFHIWEGRPETSFEMAPIAVTIAANIYIVLLVTLFKKTEQSPIVRQQVDFDSSSYKYIIWSSTAGRSCSLLEKLEDLKIIL